MVRMVIVGHHAGRKIRTVKGRKNYFVVKVQFNKYRVTVKILGAPLTHRAIMNGETTSSRSYQTRLVESLETDKILNIKGVSPIDNK